MASHLVALCFDAIDPLRLARFWAGVLGWEIANATEDGIALLPSDDTGFKIRFLPTEKLKVGQNRIHFDLTSTSLEDQQQTVARALRLGARYIDIGQRGDEGHVVLADPEVNEFCVIEPGNSFLADCGFIGAVNCDGSQEVGYFWSEALGWPLVWDQDQETAIQSPSGGSKIITCPTFVTDNETDVVSTGQGKMLYDHLTCTKQFRLFTEAEGAEGHCEGMAPTVFWDAAYDWLGTALNRAD